MADGREPFQYAILRVVPRVERGEGVNAGVVVFSRSLEFLAARTHFDEAFLRAFAPDIDLEPVRLHLAAIEQIAAGNADAGPIAQLSQSERFHWLVAPSSTLVQPSPSHMGVCSDPEYVLERLFGSLVVR